MYPLLPTYVLQAVLLGNIICSELIIVTVISGALNSCCFIGIIYSILGSHFINLFKDILSNFPSFLFTLSFYFVIITFSKMCKKEVTKNHDLTILALGEIVLAKHGKDKNWYRARVTFADEDRIEVWLRISVIGSILVEWGWCKH